MAPDWAYIRLNDADSEFHLQSPSALSVQMMLECRYRIAN